MKCRYKEQLMTGAPSDVTGFVYIHATEQIIMGTQITDSNNNGFHFQSNLLSFLVLKYNFYSVNPQKQQLQHSLVAITTAEVLILQSFHLISNSGISDVGWFDDISNDGKYIYRIGYRDVYNQLDNGVGVTGGNLTNFIYLFNRYLPTNCSCQVGQSIICSSGDKFYESLNVYGNSFISLAEDSLEIIVSFKFVLRDK